MTPQNRGTLSSEILRLAAQTGAKSVIVTEPGEWRLREELLGLDVAVNLSMVPDDRFIASHAEFQGWAAGRKSLRMSDYCGDCGYSVKAKAGTGACPFNYLYWDFIARHRERVKANPRMAQMVRTWDKFSADRQAEIKRDSVRFLSGLSGG